MKRKKENYLWKYGHETNKMKHLFVIKSLYVYVNEHQNNLEEKYVRGMYSVYG